MRQKVTLFSVLFLISALTVSLYAFDKAQVDKDAPDFTLVDSHGKSHTLSDYQGRIVVLEWINFGCPFVQKHYNGKNMQALQDKYTGEDIVWFSICSSAPGKQGHYDSNEDLNEKLKEEGSNATAYLIDESGKVGRMYDAKTTPHMYIINKEGMLVYAGAIDDKPSTRLDDLKTANNYVSERLDLLLAGKNVDPAKNQPYGCSVKYK